MTYNDWDKKNFWIFSSENKVLAWQKMRGKTRTIKSSLNRRIDDAIWLIAQKDNLGGQKTSFLAFEYQKSKKSDVNSKY